MRKLIRELRRREVFRAAGLYVGIAWIVIEVSSVVLPAFGAPDWVLRAMIIVAVVGFPVAVVMAWVYDITESGIVIQQDATDTVVLPVGGRRMDFVVIGLLTVALIVSVYLNVNLSRAPAESTTPDPVSLLIADFENGTGNPLFDGTVEQALALGIEGASFITAYPRDRALKQAVELGLGDRLNEETSRLVAVRQDVRMVLAGRIASAGDRFELSLRAVNPATGEEITAATERAEDASAVLGAINDLAVDFRQALGEQSLDLERLAAGETVTAASLEAMKHYTTAQQLARDGQDEAAIEFYERAVAEDPDMARAYSGWGLSAYKIGRASEAEAQWQKALSLLDRMTERERFRTLGLYYTVVSLNYDKAIENYQELVKRFPADGAGNNNLAILYTFTARYREALAQSEQLLRIYPGRTLYHANHAQYAMYAGDVATARAEAQRVIDSDPTFFKSYMILAVADLFDGDAAGARSHYLQMAQTGVRGASLAAIGLADIALSQAQYDGVIAPLEDAIATDLETGDERGAGTKRIAVAQARLGLDDEAAALAVLDALEGRRGDGQLVPSAEMYAALGRLDEATAIADDYRSQLRPTARAYAAMIDGLVAARRGQHVEAINFYRAAIAHADLWIVRYYLAQAYFAAGYFAEATAEFDACIARRSETGGLFFDDVPTWRYTAALEDWRARANAALIGARAD